MWKEVPGSPSTCEIYFYGATGQKLETYSCLNNNGTWSSTLEGINIYFGGKLLQVKGVWVATDKLGSVRANSNGETFAYFPYGEERANPTTPDGREKFATYTRDGFGQDYAEQRYYNSNVGAFWSPDPGGIRTANPADPTSWNRYAYVSGDPVNFIDPGGGLRCNPEVCSQAPVKTCSDESDPLCSDPTGPGYGAPVGPPAQNGGGGGGTNFKTAQGIFQKDAEKIANKKSFSKNCNGDFAALGTTADAVQADAANVDIENGAGSTALESSLFANTAAYAGAQAQYGSETIGQFMMQNPGTVAEAQLSGNAIYINPSLINPTNYYQNLGTVLHEILHNVTGLSDDQIQGALGLSTNQVSNNITQKLIKDCF
jgi:RHS repeat-associated protein